MQLQPEFTGSMQRAFRSELLRREVDEAIARAVVLTAVAEGVPLGRGGTRSYSPQDAPDLLTGPHALVQHPEWDHSGVPLPALADLAERVQVAVAEGQRSSSGPRPASSRAVEVGEVSRRGHDGGR